MSHHQYKILVISDPPAAPGYSPRLRYICDYLVRRGYLVTLLTEKYQPLPFEHSYPIHSVTMYSGSMWDWFVKTVWTILTDWHNRVFARRALLQFPITDQQYDLVLCSAFSDFPLGAAKRIAELMHVPLLCDIRDLDEQVDNSRYQYHHQSWWLMPFRRLYRAVHLGRRNKVLRAANAITTVSPWHADFIRSFNPNVHVIYNGFDERQFYPENIPAPDFVVSYIGSLSKWQEPALTKVQQAIEKTGLPIRLEVHTPNKEPIAFQHMGDAIRQSSIMCVFTATHTHGMLTTKFYEAFGCEKPILCVPSDEGALAELMAYTHAGLATDNIEQIARFITARYHEWQQHGYTHQQTQHRDEFTRSYQCERLEAIMNTLI